MNHDALIEEIAEKHEQCWHHPHGPSVKEAIVASIAEFIERQPAEVQEPVAWRQWDEHSGWWVYYETQAYADMEALYTHPAPDAVSVPVEPTEEMRKAMAKADDDYSNNRFYGRGDLSRMEFIYKAMISAAPHK